MGYNAVYYLVAQLNRRQINVSLEEVAKYKKSGNQIPGFQTG